jgi:hypothetical protein
MAFTIWVIVVTLAFPQLLRFGMGQPLLPFLPASFKPAGKSSGLIE